jgi:hypothetical protein
MLEYLVECVSVDNLNENVIKYSDVFTPLFNILDNNLPHLTFCRSILITSDRISSSINDLSEVSVKHNDYLNVQNKTIITKCKYDNTPRYLEQQEIVKACKQTTIVKAPAGFGKILLGCIGV